MNVNPRSLSNIFRGDGLKAGTHSHSLTNCTQVAQAVKNLPVMQETVTIPELERSTGEGNGNPRQYSRLENSMGRGAS